MVYYFNSMNLKNLLLFWIWKYTIKRICLQTSPHYFTFSGRCLALIPFCQFLLQFFKMEIKISKLPLFMTMRKWELCHLIFISKCFVISKFLHLKKKYIFQVCTLSWWGWKMGRKWRRGWFVFIWFWWSQFMDGYVLM